MLKVHLFRDKKETFASNTSISTPNGWCQVAKEALPLAKEFAAKQGEALRADLDWMSLGLFVEKL